MQNSGYVKGKTYNVQVGGRGYGNNVIGGSGPYLLTYNVTIPY